MTLWWNGEAGPDSAPDSEVVRLVRDVVTARVALLEALEALEAAGLRVDALGDRKRGGFLPLEALGLDDLRAYAADLGWGLEGAEAGA